ncbi:MAG: hypothetical protein AAF657_19820, partial [Acidobacteriota bacterium]
PAPKGPEPAPKEPTPAPPVEPKTSAEAVATPASQPVPYDAVTRREIRNLGLYMAFLLAALLALTLILWPGPDQLQAANQPAATGNAAGGQAATAADVGQAAASEATLFEQFERLPFNRRILLMVVIVSMLGSVIGASASFVTYVGNGTFRGSWIWWYGLRPLMGAALALVLYFVAQAGFLDSPERAHNDGTVEELFYAAVAIAGLAGMFSKLTADKLEEVFKAILQSEGDAKRTDKLKATS